jgi:hypothetical protein
MDSPSPWLPKVCLRLADDFSRDDENEPFVAAVELGDSDHRFFTRLHGEVADEEGDGGIGVLGLSGSRGGHGRDDLLQPGFNLNQILFLFFDVFRLQGGLSRPPVPVTSELPIEGADERAVQRIKE